MADDLPETGRKHLRVPMWLITAAVLTVLGQTGAMTAAAWRIAMTFVDMQKTVAANEERSKASLSVTQFSDLMVARDVKIATLADDQKQLFGRVRSLEIAAAERRGGNGAAYVPYRRGYGGAAPVFASTEGHPSGL